MTALSQHAPITKVVGGMRRRIMTNALIYDGSILGFNSTGHMRAYVLGDRFAGHALEGKDNANGSAGGRDIQTIDDRYELEVALSGVALTDAVKRSPVYAQDSGTLSLRSGHKIGKVVQYVRSGVAVVKFDTEIELHTLAETMLYDGFTDNTDATGYKDFATAIPAGAFIIGWQAKVVTGFTGNSSAVLQVGVSGNLNAFSQITAGSVYTSSTIIGSGALAVTADASFCDTDTTVRATVTGGTDFTNISAGEMDLMVHYLLPRAE